MSTFNNLPDYETLFGDLDFKEGDKSRSVYSPAAYLADLLQLMDDEFTTTTDVESRRSDIRKLLLDYENTFEEIPYLEVVNEVLETKISGHDFTADADYDSKSYRELYDDAKDTIYSTVYGDKLLRAKYPFKMPFSLYHAEGQLYLRHLGITSEELYKMFSPEHEDDIIAREYLGLSQEEYDLIIKNDNTDAEIETCYGYSGSTFTTYMANVTTFLETTDLTGVQARELLFQKLREGEEYTRIEEDTDTRADEFPVNFFTNYGLDDNEGYATLDSTEENIIWSDSTTYSNVPYAWFDRANRFVRLAEKAGISYTDLDLILRHCCNTTLDDDAIAMVASVKKLKEAFEVDYDVIVALLTSVNEMGQSDEKEPADLFNRIFNNQCVKFDDRYITGSVTTYSDGIAEEFAEESDYTEIPYYNDLFSDETGADNYDFRKRVRYVLGLSKTDLEKIIQRLDDRKHDKEEEIKDSLWMVADNKIELLNFLYRFTKLASALDISHEELFTLFDVLEADPTIASYNQQNTFLSYLPSQQDCYKIFLNIDTTDEGSIKTSVMDRQWLLHTLHYLAGRMADHGFSADMLYSITTGKFKTEEDAKTIDNARITTLNNIYQGFKPLVLNTASFVQAPFDKRSSGVIYYTLETILKHRPGGHHDVRLASFDKEEVKMIARKAVDQLDWVTPKDFMGLGIEEKLSEKLFRNLVFKGYVDEQGIIQPDAMPAKDDFEIETDFSELHHGVFGIIQSLYKEAEAETENPEDIAFALFPSDMSELNLTRRSLDELYDNLVFNNYIDEEGNIQHPLFFADNANRDDFDIDADLDGYAPEVYEIFEKKEQMFRKGRLIIDPSAFSELPLKEVEVDDLIENLVFNEYLTKGHAIKDKKRFLTEDVKDFGIALQFYPHRRAIFRALREKVEAHQKEYMTIDSAVLSGIADKIVAKWAYQDLQADYLNGARLLPEADAFFADEENKKELILSYYFDNLPGTIVFDRMAGIIKTIGSFRLTKVAFADLKFSDEETDEAITVLKSMEAITEDHKLPVGSLDYYLDSNNALTFEVEAFEDYSKDIFFLLQAVARRVKEAREVIENTLTEAAKKQDDYLFGQLQGTFGLDTDIVRSVSREIFPGQKDLKAAWLTPILSAVNVLDTVTEEPKDAAFNTAFGRIRRFALLAGKLQLAKEDVELAFRDQNLVAKFPETLKLDDFQLESQGITAVDNIDALLEGDHFVYLFHDSKYWIYRKADYVLVDKTDLPYDDDLIELQQDDDKLREMLEDDPIRLLFEKEGGSIDVTAAFKDKEGHTYILSGDHYFLLPKGSDTWDKRDNEFGNIDNNFEAMTEIDAAYKDEEGRLFLFANDEYVRYSDNYDYIDEEYPKKIAESWKDENLKVTLPAHFVNEPGAAFEGADGYSYFFHHHEFISSEYGDKIMHIADHWGKLEYPFRGGDHIDAILKDGADTYLFAGEVMVKYTDCLENEGIQVAEGFPKRIIDHYPALPYEFAKGIDAAFRGEDGQLHFIKDRYAVSFEDDAESIELMDVAEVWGLVKNNIQTDGTIDAAIRALDGRVYLFSGDQYFRYSTADYSKADSGYPRTTAKDFRGLRQVEAAFVLGGKTYLFGVDENGDQMYVRYSTPDYTEADEEDEDEAGYITPVESLPDVEDVETFPREQNDDEWWSFPQSLIDAGFTKVDAVFNAPGKTTYLFAGEYVVEYKEAARWWSEPEKITEKWDKLPDTFTSVTAAFTGKDGKIYLFSGTQYVRISDGDFWKVDNGYPRTIGKYWGEIDNNIEKHRKVDAALVLESREDTERKINEEVAAAFAYSSKAYLFNEDQYTVCHIDGSGVLSEADNYPKTGYLSDFLVNEFGFERTDVADYENKSVKSAYILSDALYIIIGSDNMASFDLVGKTVNASPSGVDADTVFAIDSTTLVTSEDGETLTVGGNTFHVVEDSSRVTYVTIRSAFAYGDSVYLFSEFEYMIADAGQFDGSDIIWTATGKIAGVMEAEDFIDVKRHTYLFAGDQIFRYLEDDYTRVEQGYPKMLSELKDEPRFGELKADLHKITAACADDRNVYLFEGSNCHVVSDEEDHHDGIYETDDFAGISAVTFDEGSVYTLESGIWQRLSSLEADTISKEEETPNILNEAPEAFKTGLSAVLSGTDNNIYLFKGTQCYNTLLDLTYDTGEEWGKPRNNIETNETIDAAFVGRDGKTYVFSGDQYFVYETDIYVGQQTEDPPEHIAKKWAGLTSVMLAYVRDDKTYLFEKPDTTTGRFRYLVYSNDTYETPDAGYPRWTDISFFGIPDKQIEEGFDRFDTILMHGDNMIFIKDQDFIRYNTDEENWSYPKELELLYPGIPFNKTTFQDLKTAFKGADDTVYFFDEDHYVTYADGVFSGVTEIKDNWGLVSNNLETQVDAAFVYNGQITYLFSGNKYVRYSTSDYRYVDEGYPKEVARDLRTEEPFAFMPKEFQYALDEIEASEEDEVQINITGVYANARNTYIFLNDKLYVGAKMRYDTLRMSHLGKVRNNFMEKGMIDAAFVLDAELVTDGEAGKTYTYLFSGDQYIRYSDSYYRYIDEGYPKLIVDDLAGELGIDSVPDNFNDGIDAAFTDNDGNVYLFRDEHYITTAGDDHSGQAITGQWGKIHNNFLADDTDKTVDAAYIDEEGRLLVFKGDQYIRYTDPKELFTEDDRDELRKYIDTGYPMLLEDHPARLPQDFKSDLDAAFMFEGRLYFVKALTDEITETTTSQYVMAIDGYHAYDDNIYPQAFKYRWGEWADYLLSDIFVLARFKKLQDTFSTDQYTLSGVLHLGDGAEKEPYLALAEIFGFDKDEVRWVKQHNAFLEAVSSFEKQFDMERIIKLYDILAKAQEMDVDASNLYEDVWTNIYINDALATAAEKLRQMLGTVECNDNYQARLDQIDGELNTLKRDVLVPYAIATDADLDDARDLYERLLIDVMMESDATTSRLKEATMAMQLYFHRYFINLEEVDLAGSNDEEVKERLRIRWKWMKNYRVWEANRKVFLYPENYIRPELRDEDAKSPAFEALEQDLMQGEITEDAVERVYKKYLDEYTEVSRLKIAGGYVYDQLNSVGNNDKNLVLFGRTRTSPMRYYYRFASFVDGESSGATYYPWRKVEVAIESGKVYPVYAFYRVFAFWAVIESYLDESESAGATATVTDTGDSESSVSSENTIYYRVNIYFSFYNLNEEWSQPQLLKSVDTTSSGAKISTEITEAELYVENAERLSGYQDYEYENILISCQYTVASGASVIKAYSLTSGFAVTESNNAVSYDNNGRTLFGLIFPNEDADTDSGDGVDSVLDDEDIIMLNSSENTTDGPWFAYDYKEGGFLVKPTTPAISSDWPLSLSEDNTLPHIDNITAAFCHNGTTYYFTGENQYFTDADISDGAVADGSKTANTTRWGQLQNNIQTNEIVDAGFNDGTYVYLFSGNQFYRYAVSDSLYQTVDDGFPQLLADNTLGFPTAWDQVDAAFKGKDGNTYLFNTSAGKYIILGSTTEYNIIDKWGIIKNNFTDSGESVQVVASFVYDSKIYLFNDDQYIRYSSDDFTAVDDGYPRTGYIKDLLIDLGFDETTASSVGGTSLADKRLDSAYVAGDTLYIHYHSGLGIACDLANFTISEDSSTMDETVFTFDDDGDTVVIKITDTDSEKLTVIKGGEDKGYFYFKKGEDKMIISSAFVYNDDIYLFSGQEYMIIATDDIDTDKPKKSDWEATGQIADTFGNGVSPSFDKIDAAYVFNDYTYLISDENYVRYAGTDYDNVESSGTVADLLPNLPGDWGGIVHAVIPHFEAGAEVEDYHYFINNTEKKYVLLMENNTVAINESNTIDYWGILKTNNFDTGAINAAYLLDSKLYLFSGNQYGVHLISGGQIEEYMENAYYPKTINGISNVSAAFLLEDSSDNEIVYLIVNDQYYKIEAGETPENFASTGASIKGNWGNIPGDMQSGMTAALDTDTHLYFFKGDEYVQYSLNIAGDDNNAVPYEIYDTTYEIVRLTTNTADTLNQALLRWVDDPAVGISGLLNATIQQTDESPSFSIVSGSTAPSVIEVNSNYVSDSNLPASTHLDFDSANGIYYWEVFFHAPFYIAMALNADQKFEYAKEWYEYIFDPTESSDYWKFLPFLATDVQALLTSLEGNLAYFEEAYDELDDADKDTAVESTITTARTAYTAFEAVLDDFIPAFRGYTSLDDTERATLADLENWTTYTSFYNAVSALNATYSGYDSDKQTFLEEAKINLEEVLAICTKLDYRYGLMQNTTSQITTYLEDPFDPHTIAEYRKIAYRKAIVMNYIDNLLDWGDMLFRQYTRESIGEARMLYVLAYDLLGKKPENLGKKVLSDDVSYSVLKHYENPAEDDYDFIFDLENADSTVAYDSFSFSGTVNDSIADPYFFVPENELFTDYWGRVEDRLYKIRHSLNIKGEKQPLALFQPPIDPMAIVSAVAGGGGLSAALAGMAAEVPHYRFGYMLGKAKELAQMVEQFGGELLAAIEKKDAEALSMLQNSQEHSILHLTTTIKDKQIDDAQKNIDSLIKSKENAEMQLSHYQKLLKDDWLTEEQQQLNMMIAGIALQSTATVGYILSAIASVVPQFSMGPFNFGVTTGGMQAAEFLEKTNESFQTAGEVLMTAGELAGMRAQHERTKQDWRLQRDMAQGEINQLAVQIASAEIQKAIAQHEMTIHEKEIENNKSMATFMQEKFSNKALYQWMASKLSGMYYDAYKMAHDMAKQAEKAFQFETGTKATDVSYIGGTYWDSQKKGLLAGISLNFDLARMEKAYIEQDERTFEITKNISLLELDPLAFFQLKLKGVCEFRLTEALFDYDFPGHYKRQMKTIALAFSVGEGQYVNATLTQLNNKVVMEDDIKAVKYLLDAKGNQPLTIRSDWKANQQIALSYVDQYTENNGMFELRYYDDRYLPFEGTGAVSLWRLELNGKKGFTYNVNDLLDVTVKLRYTANQGGSAFANAVKSALKPYNATAFFDVAYNFTDQWNEFLLGDSKDLMLPFTRDMFPGMSGSKAIGIYVKYEYEGDKKATFELNDELALPNNAYMEAGNLNIAREGSEWKFTVKGNKASITNMEMVVVYKAKP